MVNLVDFEHNWFGNIVHNKANNEKKSKVRVALND